MVERKLEAAAGHAIADFSQAPKRGQLDPHIEAAIEAITPARRKSTD
jgi:hypothetical protein